MITNYLGKIALLAALYMLTGALGLLLAVPPGYATIIWPASGIAIGMLIMHGARLWPGVLLGSCLLNAWNSGVFGADGTFLSTQMLAACAIAAGSTLQALAGRALVSKFIGVPLQLETMRQIGLLLVLGGPLTCVIAASVGVATLYSLGIVDAQSAPRNWLSWWGGDTLGVLVFMPLVLMAPGSSQQLTWRHSHIGRLPLAALLLLLLPVGLTFYAWKAASENDYQRGEAKFQTLTIESQQALQSRIASYGNALLGAAGFIQGSPLVTRNQWRTYVQTINLRENFPGISGMGWVQSVAPGALTDFVKARRAEGSPGFSVHPVSDGPQYIISYVEPESENGPAIGLNIAFERQRLDTANIARDSGEPAITGRVVLIQDTKRSPGFLLLFPIYHEHMPLHTIEDRRAALRGWTYAPFIAENFLDGLTHSQHSAYRIRIYDGGEESAQALIYSSPAGTDARPGFSVRSRLNVMQRQWLIVWESTPSFERSERSTNPLFMLIGGLLFAALLALLLLVLTARRTAAMEKLVGERKFLLPALVFAVLAAGSGALYSKLLEKERDFVLRQVQDEASKIASLLRTQASDRVATLGRMAARWEAARGTDFELWRRDAHNHVRQLRGLRALEWIDASYRVRWIEPLAGNESALGLNVLFDPQRAQALRGAAERKRATITPPLLLVQGYEAFIVYLPLQVDGRFDGFIAGAFSIDDFFHGVISEDLSRNYTVSLMHGGREYFASAPASAAGAAHGSTDTVMRLEDQTWTMRVSARPAFVSAQESELPFVVLIAGLLVAALSALSVRYILISRLKSAHLDKSLQLNAGIISSSAHLVIAIDDQYRIMIFNHAAEQALGYRGADLIGRRAIPIFLDANELEERARSLSAELGETIAPGPEIFTRIPLRDGFETREWAFVRQDGTRFPANVTITPLRDLHGAATGFVGVIEDLTARKEVDRIKSEFTAVVSHELRTPLTSIRGSLGLILGALSASLPEKVKDLLEIAQSNCERLVLLTNDILDIEKFSAGQMRFEMQRAPLGPLLLQAIEANEGYARRFQVRLELSGAGSGCTVEVDADRLIQVMTNLLSNAVKYSPTGGVVRVASRLEGDHVRISVQDAGPGVDEAFRQRIFEKFSQADSSTTRTKGGTGLGLHIARRFVERMHGRIGFDSAPGKGATFWIDLPLASQREQTSEPSDSAQDN